MLAVFCGQSNLYLVYGQQLPGQVHKYSNYFRFSDKNQKAIDLLRTRCLKLKSLVLCDGKLYEIMRGNFERADRRWAMKMSGKEKEKW